MSDKLDVNIRSYESSEALDKYSTYILYPVEKYLVKKYFSLGDRVLDLGCGGGRTTVRLHELGFQCKGVDLSETLIEAAKKRFPHISFERGSYCELSETVEYDIVLISHNGLDYAYPVQQRKQAIQQAAAVIRREGLFIFSSHNLNSLLFSPYYLKNIKRIIWKLKNMFIPLHRKEAYVYDLGMYTYYATNKTIIKQVEEVGFSLVEVVGFRNSNNPFFLNYISPFNHFVFRKN